jgi:hypothetical protein
MPDGDITIGELSRTISGMEKRINDRFDAINRRFDGLEFVHRETYTVQMGMVIDRVEALEESKRWLLRMLAGAFFVAFLAPVLVAWMVVR